MVGNYINKKVEMTITYGDLDKIAVIVNEEIDSTGNTTPIKYTIIVEPFKGCIKTSHEEIVILRDILNEAYKRGDL